MAGKSKQASKKKRRKTLGANREPPNLHMPSTSVPPPTVATPSTTSPWSNIPEEILMESILPRIPIKSLVRLKCVNKRLHKLISQPRLAQHIRDRAHPTFRSLVLSLHNNRYTFQSIITSEDGLKILDQQVLHFPGRELTTAEYSNFCTFNSCHGLVLIGDGMNSLYVWNPVLNECRQVAIDPPLVDVDLGAFAIGYDSVSDDYKIVKAPTTCAARNRDSNNDVDVSLKVFSLNTNSWRVVAAPPNITTYYDYGTLHNHKPGITLNGIAHWPPCLSANGAAIVYFDFSKEMLGELPLPLSLQHLPRRREGEDFSFGVYKGCLSVVQFDQPIPGHVFFKYQVWVMKEYGERDSWTILYRFKDSDLFALPLWFSFMGGHDGDGILWGGVPRSKRKPKPKRKRNSEPKEEIYFALCNPETNKNKYTRLGFGGEVNPLYSACIVVTESLISPNALPCTHPDHKQQNAQH